VEQPSPATELHQPRPQPSVQSPTPPEQIRTSGLLKALDELGSVPFHSNFERLIERVSLGDPEAAHERFLVCSAGSNQCSPDARELSHGFRAEHFSREPVIDRIEQTVALPNEAIQVGERADLRWVLGRIISDDRQPKAQLCEAYRRRGEIHTEQILLKHGSLLIGRKRAWMHPVETLEGAKEERA
jgi:hypothetical protein